MGPKNHSQSPETLLSGRGRGGRGGRGKGRGRGTREEEGTNTGAALDFAPEALEPVYPVTSCSICHGIDDDDLTILCDGNNCSKEAHLYCLQPPLFHVPEGDWYCDTCDPVGTTKHLTEYFQTHDTFAQSISDYEMFLSFLPQRYCSLEDMRVFVPDYCQRIRTTTSSSAEQAESKMETDIEEDSTESHQIRNLLRCEFENEGKEYLGCKVSLLCLIDQRYHTGRILGRRFHQEKQCYEHYVVFKK